MDENLNKGEIVIYTSEDGSISLDTKLENDTIWLTQKQMAVLFDKNVRTVNEHIKNIFKEGELDENSVIRNFRTTANDGKQYDMNYYNLDVIISVGYRVKSLRGTQFRIWATNTLRNYLTKGYVINENKLKQQQEQIALLKNSIAMMERSMFTQIDSMDVAKDVSKLLNNFALGLNLLDDYDHKNLDKKGLNKAKVDRITTEDFLKVVNDMNPEFKSGVFAVPKDNGFESAVTEESTPPDIPTSIFITSPVFRFYLSINNWQNQIFLLIPLRVRDSVP